MKPKLPSFLVIEDSGLGHAFCNAKKTVKAKNALEAAKLATQCPIDMVVEKNSSEDGVWEVFDVVSHKGWSGITDPEHLKVLETMAEKGFVKKFSWPKGHPQHGKISYDPVNQWIVTVVRR